jgi:hypothetical protein
MRRSRYVSIGFVVWVVIGVIVAASHHYFSDLKPWAASCPRS